MKSRSESLNGRHSHQESAPKSVNPGSFFEQVKNKTSNLKNRASNYAEITADYAEQHPWRIAFTAASLGVVIGAILGRRKSTSRPAKEE